MNAASFQVGSRLDRQEIALNEQAVLSLTISGASSDLPQPQLPALQDFQITNAGESQSYQWINGKASSSVTYNYVLTPLKAGHLTIPPVHISYKGETVETPSLTLDVIKGDAGAIPAPVSRSAPAAPQQRRSTALFISGTVDKNSVYVGEPVTYIFRLYNRVNLLRQPNYEAPSTQGFWSEDLPPQRTYQTVEKGVPYNVTEVRTALFPTTAGHAHIGAAGLRVELENVGTDPFSNDFFANFFGRGEEKVLHTEPIAIHVKPLPEPKPAGFKGAVGHYTLTASVDKESTTVGQPLTLTLTIAGRGHIKSLPNLPLPPLTNFRTFDANASTSIDKKEYQVHGSKVFKTVLIPAASGDLQIPAVSFVFFDPDTGQYTTLQSRALTVHVAPGSGGAAMPATSSTPGGGGNASLGGGAPGIQMLSEDVRYIKTPGSLARQGEPLIFRWGFWILNILAFLSILGGALFRLYQKLFLSNTARTRFKFARAQALAEIARAQEAVRQSHVKEASGLLSDALRNFIAAKLDSPTGVLSLRDQLEALKTRGLHPHDAEKVRNLWETLDLFQFAPTQVRPEELQKAVDTLKHILDELEASIQWKE